MREFCMHCGAELREQAGYCPKCGKPVLRISDGAPQAVAEPLQAQRVQDNGNRIAKLRFLMERYILLSIALLACLVVFISGFFIKISFIPLEGMHTKPEITGYYEIDEAVLTLHYEQNVINVFAALTVEVGGDKERLEELMNELTERAAEIIMPYQTEISDLDLQVYNGNFNAREDLVALFNRIAKEIAQSCADINLIEFDRQYAECLYYTATGDQEKNIKLADDSLIRSAIMVGYPVGVLYLQIVSLVFLIVATIELIMGKKKKFGVKFFCLYLIGMVFLFAIAQLSATAIGGTGMFCFIFVSVMLLLYLIGRMLTMQNFSGKQIISVAADSSAAILSFIALCVLFAGTFKFGAVINKIGAVFGLHSFDRVSMEYGEGISITTKNLVTCGSFYLVTLVMLSVAFFLSVSCINKGGKGKLAYIIMTAIAAIIAISSYISLHILIDTIELELYSVPSVYIAIFVLLCCSLIIAIAGNVVNYYLGKSKKQKSQFEKSEDIRENVAVEN